MRALYLAIALLTGSAMCVRADPITLKDSVPHITVTGMASREVVPDRARLSLGVANERPDADAAAQATAQAASAVLADIKTQGIAAKDIVTSVELSPQFDIKRDASGRIEQQKLRGYLAIETIDVRIEDISKVGALTRALIAKGANTIGGVSFSYSRRKEALRELNGAALRDAVAEAHSYTDAAGLKLGRVLQIGEDPQSIGGEADLPLRRAPPYMSVAFPMEPGSLRLTQNVTVIFEIGGTAP